MTPVVSLFENRNLRTLVPGRGNDAAISIYHSNPNVCLVFSKSSNGNVVCMECVLDSSNKAILRLSSYWLNLEPRNRNKRNFEFERLSRMERKLAFGSRVVQQDPCGTRLYFSFNKFPSKVFMVELKCRKKGEEGTAGCSTYCIPAPQALTVAGAHRPEEYTVKVCTLHAVVERKSMSPLPSVKKVLLVGYCLQTKQLYKETVSA